MIKIAYFALGACILSLNTSLSHAIECEDLLSLMPVDVAIEAPLALSEINYEYYENPQGKETLVLIHGMDSALQTFMPILSGLKPHFNVLIYDQRGHGRTQDRGFNYSSKLLAQDLKSLVDNLKISKFHILGHSFGARTAVRFAQLYPDQIQSVIIEDMEMIKRQDFNVEEIIEVGQKIATFPQKFKSEQELFLAFQKLYGVKTLPPTTRFRKNNDGSIDLLYKPYVGYLYGHQAVMEDFTEALRQVSVSVLVLKAQEGRSAVSEKGAAHLLSNAPHAKLITIPNAHHNVHGTQPELFLLELVRFISDKTGRHKTADKISIDRE